MSEEKKYQASKSTSNKRLRRKRDTLLGLPHSEFLGIASTFSGLVLSLLFGLTIYNNTFAASSISITLSGDVELNLARSNDGAVYGKSSEQTAHIESDHFTGYTFTIQGYDNEGSLIGKNNPANKITSIPEEMSQDVFRATANNQWGFLPDTLRKNETTITNNNYQPAPKTTPTEIDKTTSPNKTDGGKDYKLAIGARVDSTMSLDSYGQTFILAATGNGYDYHIGFTDNMTNLPDDIYGHEDTASVNLPSTTPTKDGFVFGGWCAQPTTVDPVNGTSCPSGVKVYRPGEAVDLVATDANNMLLYAIWTKGYDTFAAAFNAFHKSTYEDTGYYMMQDITPEICDSVVIGSPSLETEAGINANTLIDARNEKTYLVAKYADGHCWMRENLNYVFTENGTVEAYNFQTGETFNYTTPLATQTDTGTAWEKDASDGPRSFQRDKDNCIGGTDITTPGGAGATCNSLKPYERIGVFYNWAAATAQTGEEAAAAGSSGDQVIPTSICPKGWRLPANSGDYSFSTLMGSYGLPTTNQSPGYSGQLQNPLNFNRPGYYNWSGDALYYRGTNGYFWSSVGFSVTYAYYFLFRSSSFYPHYGDYKGQGFPVRCVAV